MSTPARAGIKAAKALLSLLDEHSTKELEAAESILGAEKELTEILQLLRKFKEQAKAPEQEPLDRARLREIVRAELVGLDLSVKDMTEVVLPAPYPVLEAPEETSEEVVDHALRAIEEAIDAPGEQVDLLTELLVAGFRHAEPTTYATKVVPLLRELAAQALTENIVMVHNVRDIAELRTRWADKLLPHQAREPRRSVVARLLEDVEQLPESERIETLRMLVRVGLRGPADAQMAAISRMNPPRGSFKAVPRGGVAPLSTGRQGIPGTRGTGATGRQGLPGTTRAGAKRAPEPHLKPKKAHGA